MNYAIPYGCYTYFFSKLEQSSLFVSEIIYVSLRFNYDGMTDKGRPSKEIRDDVDEVDWGNMPPALWSEIGERITNRLDRLTLPFGV